MIAEAYLENHEHRADIANRFLVNEELVSRIVASKCKGNQMDQRTEVAS